MDDDARAVREPSISTLIQMSAAQFQVSVIDILSRRRDAASVRARHVAMFLGRQLTRQTLPQIGRRFGGRDHTTVMHAVRSIEERIKTDTSLCEDVAAIRRAVSE